MGIVVDIKRIIRDTVLLSVREEAGLYSEVVDERNVRLRLGLSDDWVWKVVSRDSEDRSPDVVVKLLGEEVVVVSVIWYDGPADGDAERVERVLLRVYLSDPDFFGKLTGVIGSLGKYYHGVKF